MSRFVELSHPIRAGMVTYPGMPGPVLGDYLSREESRARYASGTDFHIGRIDMIANTGTYLDTPAHRFAGRADLAGVPLERVADLPGLLVDATGATAIDAELLARSLAGRESSVADTALLIGTSWSRHFGTPSYGDPAAPYVTADAVAWLVAHRPALVGIDSVNIDDVADLTRPAHTGLLDAGIYVVEHLTNLLSLPADGFRLTAVPPLIEGLGTFTVRAYAVLS